MDTAAQAARRDDEVLMRRRPRTRGPRDALHRVQLAGIAEPVAAAQPAQHARDARAAAIEFLGRRPLNVRTTSRRQAVLQLDRVEIPAPGALSGRGASDWQWRYRRTESDQVGIGHD